MTWVMEGIGSDEWVIGVGGEDRWVLNAIRVQGKERAAFLVEAANAWEQRGQVPPPAFYVMKDGKMVRSVDPIVGQAVQLTPAEDLASGVDA